MCHRALSEQGGGELVLPRLGKGESTSQQAVLSKEEELLPGAEVVSSLSMEGCEHSWL